MRIAGKDASHEKYEKNPANNVEPYAIAAVIARSFPAPLPSSAIPGATRPRIMRGIVKPRKFPNIPLIVTKHLLRNSGKKNEHKIPITIAMRTFASRGNF